MAATTRNEASVAIEGEGAELRTKDIGGEMTVAFARLAKGDGPGARPQGAAR